MSFFQTRTWSYIKLQLFVLSSWGLHFAANKLTPFSPWHDSFALWSILLPFWQWQNDCSHVWHDMSWHFPWDLKNCAIRHCLPSLQKFTPQEIMNFGKGFLPSAACPKSPWTSFFLLVYPKLTCETVGTMVQSQFAIRRACSKKNLWSCVPRPFIKCCKDKDNYPAAEKTHWQPPPIDEDFMKEPELLGHQGASWHSQRAGILFS